MNHRANLENLCKQNVSEETANGILEESFGKAESLDEFVQLATAELDNSKKVGAGRKLAVKKRQKLLSFIIPAVILLFPALWASRLSFFDGLNSCGDLRPQLHAFEIPEPNHAYDMCRAQHLSTLTVPQRLFQRPLYTEIFLVFVVFIPIVLSGVLAKPMSHNRKQVVFKYLACGFAASAGTFIGLLLMNYFQEGWLYLLGLIAFCFSLIWPWTYLRFKIIKQN